ncbi:MAG: type secretion system rane protein PorP/SprF [Bacteroidota bacterium]|jgi:type IX secretion system PorP/SprF family membrane protein|nr:type secretion system rane protein PorP/SprF [Bacteroidota bacterium]
MKNIKLVVLLLFATAFSANAQDRHYSQFYLAPLNANPGNVGVFNGDIRAYTMYRMQWFTVTNPYKTFTIAVDGPIFKKRMLGEDYFAAGLEITTDNVGSTNFKTNTFNGLISYTKYIGGRQKHDITLGYEIGYAIKSVATGGLTWDSQWDGTNYNPGVGVNEGGGGGTGYLDMSTGIVWNFKTTHLFKSALGFSFHHFTAPANSVYGGPERLIPKFGVQWNMAYKLSETSNTTLLPSLIAYQQGTSLLLNGGCNVKYVLEEHSRYTNNQNDKAFYIGAFYRFRDAAYVTVRYDYDGFVFSGAYDVNISGLTPASKSIGGFEFAIQYKAFINKSLNVKKSSARFL